MLKLIKTLHTAIWLVMASAAFYILYAGLTKTFNSWLYVSVALLVLESIILMLNKWTCPLTPMAMKYTPNTNSNFDIYLPEIIAKYNKHIFGSIFLVGLLLVVINLVGLR
jgi:hypothetical protein